MKKRSCSAGHAFHHLLQQLGDDPIPLEFQLPDWLKKQKSMPYTFIRRNVYLTKKIKRRAEDDGIFCSCSPSSGASAVCDKDCLCGMLLSSCSESCNCGDLCVNKPFQYRPAKKMKLIKTEKCGSGLVADEDIRQGDFVIEYVGEVIDDKTCEERLWKMKHCGETNFYLCEINRDMVIDATYKGNKSRFINHSCQPNTEMQKWTIDGETRIGIFATRDIRKGEELTYDYQFVQFGADQDCYCGAIGCRQMAYQEKCSGCMRGFRQFFDFHQRLRIRKMLTDRNHGDGKSYAGIKTLKSFVPSTGKKHDFLKSEATILIGNKGNTAKGRPGKGHMRALLSKKLARRQHQKQKAPPVTPQLLRTVSIHHLECNDYVLPDEVTSDNEPSTIEFSPNESDSSAASKHVSLSPSGPDGPIFGKMPEECRAKNTVNNVDYNVVYELGDHSVEKQGRLVEKINGANESLSNQKHVDAKGLGRDAVIQSRDFINLLELFRTDRELFPKLLEDQVWENFLWCRHSSSTKKLLTKSSSFPGAGLSGGKAGPSGLNHKWKESEFFVNQEKKSQLGNAPSISSTMSKDDMASKAGIKVDILKSESATMDGSSSEVLTGSTYELKSQRDHGTALNHFKDLQQRTENVVNKNRKENHRISMDRILHKVPYGQKGTEDMMKEKLYRSASAGCDGDNPRDKIGISANRYLRQSIRRSHSLTESLDRYSHLLESISIKESTRLPGSLKSSNEDSGLQHKKTLKNFARIFSNPEILRSHSFSEDVQSEVFHAESEVSATSFLGSDVAGNIHSFLGPESVGTLVHTKQIEESDTTEHNVVINVSGITDGGLERPLLMNEHDQCEIGKVSYPTEEDISHIPLHERDIGISGQPKLISEHDHNEIKELSSLTYTPLHEQESGTEMDPTDKQIPISVLDSFLEEDPATPSKCLISEDHFKEPVDSPTPENPLDADVCGRAEIIEPSSGKIQIKDLTGVDAFHIQVDKKDEAEFSYVRDVLKGYGFIGEEFLKTWYPPYPQVDPLHLGEADGRPNELDIAPYNDDMSPDHELLFDLINEVLLEIYETSFAGIPRFSCFRSQLRPMLVVYNVLREVWANITWHLSSQRQLNYTTESLVARDFAKNDVWLNLQWDAECVGMGLETPILDNLLDELTLEIDETSYRQFVSS